MALDTPRHLDREKIERAFEQADTMLEFQREIRVNKRVHAKQLLYKYGLKEEQETVAELFGAADAHSWSYSDAVCGE